MIGLFVLGMLGLWVWFAIWAARKLSNYFWHKAGSPPSATVGRWFTTVALTAFIVLLPFLDQLIAYPKWQQLCATTGDFEWGPGMDEKKAFGRELIVSSNTHETTIFPNIEVTYFSRQFEDAQTGELILSMPHSSYYKAKGMFYFPSGSGDNRAVFLNQCTTRDKSQKVIDHLNQFNLKVVEHNN